MFRSSSGPGLSISTSAANAFGSQASHQPASSGPNRSLFSNIPSTQQQTSSLFSLPKPAATDTNQQNNPMASKPAGNSFFASTTSQPTQSSGLFPSTFGQNQTQPAGNLFGPSANDQTSSSLFGATQNPLAAAQKPAPSIFSTSIGQQNPPNTVPGVRISVNELRPTTRFNDLHEELQKVIEYVDAFILNKMQWQAECESSSKTLEAMSRQLGPDVDHCNRSLEVVQQSLENDAESIAGAKQVVKADASDAQLSFKVINNLKLPPQFHHSNLWGNVSIPKHTEPLFSDTGMDDGSSRSLVEYFSKQIEDISQAIASYERNVFEVESHLKGMEVTASQQLQRLSSTRQGNVISSNADDRIRELAAVLREFENGILGVATHVGSAREATQSVMLGSNSNERRFT